MTEKPFWKTKNLQEMSQGEWESLCDGCALCCLVKLEDEDSGEIAYTDVVCELLDIGVCKCTDYENRNARVPTCIKLDPEQIHDLDWLPARTFCGGIPWYQVTRKPFIHQGFRCVIGAYRS